MDKNTLGLLMLEVVKCRSSETWDRFLETSPQQNVFSTSAFLLALNVSFDTWFLLDSGKPILGALVIEPSRKNFEAPYDYSLYQGIFFALGGSQIHSETKHRLNAVEHLLIELGRVYPALSFCLHHTFSDLRAVQWINYHSPELGQYSIRLNYTGLINLEPFVNFDAYLSSIRKVRIQEYNKAHRNGFRSSLSSDLGVFRDLYIKTFNRQGISIEEEKMERATSIAKGAIESNFGRLFLCYDSDGKPASAAVILFDSASAYYMFGASDPSFRNTGASTFLLLETIKYFFDLGMKKFDMVGINSPNRGDFKTSFNALPTPYFNISWRRPAGSIGEKT